ncbi:hypothetical protein DR864_28410 (plasmid) [Runella rosea]|uniref:Uncharacterized protein n=1 Tax=Runella rosea TaxID=2259595 RepID=A0A344TT28_9BACT|nr:hypothetical protein [Runella rosea]AXE21799.1 hypothetical protein DR864_28410 [Runella rosea]
MTTTEMKAYLDQNQQDLGSYVAIYGRVIEVTNTEIKVLCVGEQGTITISRADIKNRFAPISTSVEQLFLIETNKVEESTEQSRVSCSRKLSKVETDGSEIVFKDVIFKQS